MKVYGMWVVDAMIAYSENLKTFKQHIENNEIVDRIIEKLGFKVGASEQRAFKVSLGEMYKVLNKTDLSSDVQIGIEYRIPITSRRIDFIVSGSDGENENLVIVELKQWDRVTKTDMPGVIMLGTKSTSIFLGKLFPTLLQSNISMKRSKRITFSFILALSSMIIEPNI